MAKHNWSFKIIVLYLGKLLAFWMLFYASLRLYFLIYYNNSLDGISKKEILYSFWHALPLDFSFLCYTSAFYFIILLIQSLINFNFLNILSKIYTTLLILCLSLITASEMGLYKEWGSKLNYTALTHLMHPTELLAITSTLQIISFSIITIIIFFTGFYVYNKFVYTKISGIKRNLYFTVSFFILMPIMIILGARGGVQEIPINQSEVYYSKHQVLNDAAVNSGWNLMNSVFEYNKFMKGNSFIFYDDTKAQKLIAPLFETYTDSTLFILKNKKPNIVVFILEGWNADLAESIGKKHKNITPFFDSLADKGLLFTNIYSSGTLSDQGIVAILSGFPAQPRTSIINYPEKVGKIASIIPKLKEKGYRTSFYYGGQLIYGNIRGYLIMNGVDNMVELDKFDSDVPQGKMGVPDEYVFDRQLKEMRFEKEPFFSVIYTLSSHAPYDIPEKSNINYCEDLDINKYMNSVHYSDKCLKEYFEKAKKQKWFDNTLFVFVSDHGHYSFDRCKHSAIELRHIPMLFYGNVIKDEFKGGKINKFANNHDIPSTILKQLRLDYYEFKWSRNILNANFKNFAYYAFDIGLGVVNEKGYFIYNHTSGKYYDHSGEIPKETDELKIGKAYLNVLYSEFMAY